MPDNQLSRRTFLQSTAAAAAAWRALSPAIGSAVERGALKYTLSLSVVRKGWDGRKCYVHSRAGAIPPQSPGNSSDLPMVVMTTQKHLVTGNDIFDGLTEFRSEDLGKTWTGPFVQPALARRPMAANVIAAPCDFTPQWHAPTGRLLGTGKTFWYRNNAQYPKSPSDTIYSVYDAFQHTWSNWRRLDYPDRNRFRKCSAGCTQRYDLPNGDILLPVYVQFPDTTLETSTVVRCRFDGRTMKYVEHGTELRVEFGRGFSEPSLTRIGEFFYLTLRNDRSAYVTKSRDGLDYEKPREWTFDDGNVLGSYNTQAHWVTHSDGLFLVYTRRGANNDHVFRHRAPLFMARVDPDRLVVLKQTERIIVPETGTRMGNFGVVTVSPRETWVITTEWMQHPPPGGFARYGSDNRIFCAKIEWNRPNRLAVG